MTAKLGLVVVVTAATAAAACGGDSGARPPDAATVDARLPSLPDAGPDADLRDAAPPPRDDAGMLVFDPGVVLDSVELAAKGHSWAPYAPLANVELQRAIDDGDLILLLELRGLDDPSGQNDPDGLAIGIYNGVDLDGNPMDNFTGFESFEVHPDSLDAIGNPRALLPSAQLSGGTLFGMDPGPLAMEFPSVGALFVYDASFAGTLVSTTDGSAVSMLQNASIEGTLLARDLVALPNSLDATCLGETLLDVIALGCLAIDGVQPDVDRDGDGLEWFEDKFFADNVIDRCHDGNGEAYASLPGLPCALDPAFQDGYTVRLEVHGVRAILLPPSAP